MDQQGYITNLISQCYHARDSHMRDEKLQQLFDEASPFGSVPIAGREVSKAIAQKNLSKLAGALGMCLAADGGDKVNVTAIANATASATSFSSACAELDKVDGLDDDVKREIRSLMNDLDGEKDDTLAKTAAKKLVEVVIEKGVDALPVIAPFVAQVIGSLQPQAYDYDDGETPEIKILGKVAWWCKEF